MDDPSRTDRNVFGRAEPNTDRYGGGKADEVRAERDDAPAGMREDMDRWVENYPNANEFIIRLYETER